jgi:hypothetical protein
MVCGSSVRADDVYEGRSGHNPTTAAAVSSTRAEVICTPAAAEELALFPAVPMNLLVPARHLLEPPISTSAIVKVPSYTGCHASGSSEDSARHAGDLQDEVPALLKLAPAPKSPFRDRHSCNVLRGEVACDFQQTWAKPRSGRAAQ